MQLTRPATERTEPTSSQSLTGEVLCIDIKDIELFDRNPRRSRNPAYDRIKASILANGLDQPLIVTKRPGDEKFVVHAGGNTRLQILKELYAVSDDPAFAIVNCIFVGWDSESTVLLAHLRENDLRGDLTFIDKAVAICALEDLLTEENGCQEYSVRQLQEVLKSRGYGISGALISYMRYAVNYLLPVMPVALSDGLARRQVQKIRRLQRLGGDIWTSREIGSKEEFDGIFSELCRRYDSPDWQIEPLARAVETEIAEAVETSVQVIRMEMDCLANGRLLSDETPSAKRRSNGKSDQNGDAESNNTPVATEDADEGESVTVSIEIPAASGGTLQDAFFSTDCIDSLRYHAYEQAESLARRFGLGDVIVPLSDIGLGFLVKDIPSKAILERVDDELRASICTMWWQLLAFSGITIAPVSVVEGYLDKDSELLSILRNGKIRLLFERIWIIDPGSFADRFWCRLSQQDWIDWLQLAHSYRELNRLALEQERPLWEPLS
jgi:ParB family protein of integrating conjugative element (PFGI_1 class)